MIIDYPATMRFLLSAGSDTITTSIQQLPLHYQHLTIKEAAVKYMETDSGDYIIQELRSRHWAIGWLTFSMQHPAIVRAVTDRPMVAIVCVPAGKVSVELPGYGSFTLQKGKFGFGYMPPHLECGIFLTESRSEMVYCSFSPEFLLSFAAQHPAFQQLYEAQRNGAAAGDVLPVFRMGVEERKILDAIRHCTLTGPAQLIFLHARINDLLISYFTVLETVDKQEVRQESQRQRLMETELFIRENYHLPLRMQFLSRKAGMNLRTFEKGFKGLFGVKAKEYIEHLRVKQASELLRNTDMPVTAIAYHVGFAGTNYFSFVFKKIHHCSPREFRRRHAQQKMDKGEFL